MALLLLLTPNVIEPDYLILEEEVDKEVIELTEASEGGSVPELTLINGAAQHVLVVEGEELVGAKQDRIVNATFLLPGNFEVIIPMSCAERGRWAHCSNELESGRIMTHTIFKCFIMYLFYMFL